MVGLCPAIHTFVAEFSAIATHFTPDHEAVAMTESYVIIGDGIAGSSAAETLREEAPDADVTVITEEGEALYNRILIKEFAKGKLPEAPISIHDEDWYAERDIDLRLNTVVTDINPEGHTVSTHEGDTVDYDKLLVATGGTPTQLPVDNSEDRKSTRLNSSHRSLSRMPSSA